MTSPRFQKVSRFWSYRRAEAQLEYDKAPEVRPAGIIRQCAASRPGQMGALSAIRKHFAEVKWEVSSVLT